MQLFHLISIFVPLVFALLLPRYLPVREKNFRPLLYIACSLFFISWYLPSPLIDGEDTSFSTHFVGGGMFTGFLWLYIKKSIRWSSSWGIELFSLFMLVSALGCVNELAELFMVKADIANILLTDTNWDILANTLGSVVVFIGYALYDSWR